MKSRLKILAATLLLALALCGCQRRPENNSSARVRILENAVPGGLNSDLWDWYLERVPEVEKELGIKIELIPAGIRDEDFKARVALDLKSGRAAEIIGFDQFWVPEFAEAGFLLPLDDFWQNWPDRTQYYDSMKAMGAFKGKTYLVMRMTDLRMLFYHKPLLAQAGLPVPWQPKNWDEIISACRLLKQKFPEVIPLELNAGVEMGEATTMQGFLMLLYGAGGELYDQSTGKWVVDSEAFRQALDFYRKLYVDEKLANAELVTSPKAREKTFELFSQGKIALYVEGTWFYTSVLKPGEAWGIADRDERIGWAKMPGSGANGAPAFISLSGGNGFVINPKAENPALAWKVIEKLNSLNSLEKLFSRQALTPVRKDLARSQVVAKNKFIAESALALLPHTRSRPGLSDYPEISFLLQLMTEEVVTGRLSPNAALQEYGKSVERIVGREKVIRK